MQRTYINEITKHIGEEVLVKAFVQTIRNQGSISFLILRDVTGHIQAVVLKSEAPVFAIARELSVESVVELVGLVKAEKQAPGGVELQVNQLNVLSHASPELPIPILSEKGGDDTEIAKRFDWRWLDLRKPDNLQIFKVWTAFEKGCRKFFLDDNFIQIYTPSFMNTSSESGAQVFEVKYFDKKAYLAQSPQFYKQMAMASGFEKVYIFGPVYRAEPSYTTRHTTEFTGLDFEISYIDSHYDVMAVEEKMLVSAFESINSSGVIKLDIPVIPFPKISIKEAKEKLANRGIPSEKAFDVTSIEEIELSKIIKEETGHDFVFLTDWPVEGRPFYHMRHEDNNTLTKSFDLLYRGIEVTTGAQREHRIEILEKQALEKGMDLDSLMDYFNFFRYGCPPHGGIGAGPARFIMKIMELSSIKEAIFLPRDVKRLTP